MGSDYVNNALIVVLGIGMMLPMAQSPVNQILIGLGEHKKLSLVTVALSALIFVGGVWIIDLFSVASLEAYAMIYATSVTLTHGFIAPTYTCKIIELPISLYFKKTFVPVLKAWLVPTLLFGLLVNVMAAGIWNVLVSSMIYVFALAFSCWFFLFSESEKKKLRKLLHLPTGRRE
jgi:hypothetical protein